MTHLRKLMLEELERRNYSHETTRAYIHAMKDFSAYFKRPPDQLGPEHVREYQAYLLRERKLSPNTVNMRTGALRRASNIGATGWTEGHVGISDH